MSAVIRRTLLVAVLATSLFGSVMAEQRTFMTVSAVSYHLNRYREYNQTNPGAGLEHHFDESLSIVGGFYRNSIPTRDAVSAYGGAVYSPLAFGPVRAGVMLGFVTGYQKGKIQPAASGLVYIGGRDLGVNINFLPATDLKSLSAIGLQMRRAF